MQLDYEVYIDDLVAAANTFEAMVVEDVPYERPDVAALNHFLTKLCFAQEPNHELISRVIDRVLGDRRRFGSRDPGRDSVLCS